MNPTILQRRDRHYPIARTVGLSEETANRIDRIAKTNGLARSVVIREAISQGLTKAKTKLDRERRRREQQ